MQTSVDADIKEFDETLKTADLLVDESVQIYELENEKINVIDELYNSLKSVTEFLGFSVNIPSNIFKYSSNTKITLTPSLEIIIIHENGKEEQKRFDELTVEQITQILKHAVTPIIELTKKEKELQNKNTFMRTISDKFSKIQNINNKDDTQVMLKEDKGDGL